MISLSRQQFSAIRIASGLAWRYVLARLLSVSGLLLAAYFYDPHDFAVFGFYVASLNIASIVYFLRFDGAIVSIARDKLLQPIFHLCLWVGGFTTLVFIGTFLIGVALGLISPLIAFCFVLALVGRGFIRLSTLLATREGDFTFLGRMMMLQSVVQPFALFSLMTTSLAGFLVLLLADIAGVLCALCFCLWHFRKQSDLFSGFWRDVKNVPVHMRAWRALPILNLPSSMLAVVFSSLPLLFVSFMASPLLAGHVALAGRILDMPTQLIGAAATPLMLNRFNEKSLSLFSKIRVVLSFYALSILVFFGLISVFIYVFSPLLIDTKWQDLLIILPILTIFYAGLSIAGPLIEVESTFQSQKTFLTIQIVACLSALTAALLFQEHLFFLLVIFGSISILRGLMIMSDVMRLYRLSVTDDVESKA